MKLRKSRLSDLVLTGLIVVVCLAVYAWANDELAQYQGLGQLALISEKEQEKYDMYRSARLTSMVVGGGFLLLFIYTLGMFMSEHPKKKS